MSVPASGGVRIHDARICTLGEGPLWHPERGELFWFDILKGRLCSQAEGRSLAWDLGEMASAAGWVDRDTLLVATETGLRRFDIVSGTHEPLARLEAERTDTRSNDGRADPWGGFWIGTMSRDEDAGQGTIYRFLDGVVEPLFRPVSISNAICFDPGRTCAYFADTPTKKVMRVSLDAEGWPDAPPETFADFTRDGLYPDGAVTDADGHVWVALWGAGRVVRLDGEGRIAQAIDLGAAQTTCPAFGGADMDRLYVTSAAKGLVDAGPSQGMVFVATPGVKGLPEPRVRLS